MLSKEVTDTLIMTSAINPVCGAPGVHITEPRIRLFQMCCALVCWLQTEEIKNIVICDNTLPDLKANALQRIAGDHEKNLELLSFLTDRGEIKRRGKGFGEGEILKFALNHSFLIDRCRSFYKITGRLYVQNFGLIHSIHRKNPRVFDNPIPRYRRSGKRIAVCLSAKSRHRRGMVGTVFFKCDSEFFRKRLFHRNEIVDDHQRFYLEHAYFFPLIKSGFSTFKVKPVLVGFSSSSGALYQDIDYAADTREKAKALMAKL